LIDPSLKVGTCNCCISIISTDALHRVKKTIYIPILILSLTLFSCDRIKSKGQELSDKAKEKVKNKSKDVIDKAFPFFDSYKADTKFNKERFKEFLRVDLTPDVKNIFVLMIQLELTKVFNFHLIVTHQQLGA